MNILIADDHAVVRRGLKDILVETIPGANFIEAANGNEVLARLIGSHASLVILDINMPGRGGLDVLGDINRTYPRLPVIMLSMQPEELYAVRCMRAGASAYINKSCAPEELAHAARKILAGGRYISQHLAELLLEQTANLGPRPLHELLSDREHEVMRKIAAGKSLTEIAEGLHLSVKTVSTYRTRILEKMKATTNAELIRYAIEQRLID